MIKSLEEAIAPFRSELRHWSPEENDGREFPDDQDIGLLPIRLKDLRDLVATADLIMGGAIRDTLEHAVETDDAVTPLREAFEKWHDDGIGSLSHARRFRTPQGYSNSVHHHWRAFQAGARYRDAGDPSICSSGRLEELLNRTEVALRAFAGLQDDPAAPERPVRPNFETVRHPSVATALRVRLGDDAEAWAAHAGRYDQQADSARALGEFQDEAAFRAQAATVRRHAPVRSSAQGVTA